MTANANRELRATLVTLGFGAFACQASVRICDAMLPQLSQEFGVSIAAASAVIAAFVIAYGLSQLLHGPLGDRFGKLRVIRIASSIAAVGSLACAFAPGLDMLTMLRFVTGAAASAVIPLTIAWVGDEVAYHVRQRTLARLMAGSNSGMIFGLVMGGFFADTIGWRAGFAVLAVALATTSIALWVRARRVASAAAVASGLDAVRANATTASAPAAIPAPVQSLSPQQIARQFATVLRNGRARLVLAIVVAEGALAFGALAFIPTFLHLRHGMPLWMSGLVVAGFGVGGISYALSAHWLVPRMGERGLSAVGGLLLCIGVLSIGGPYPMVEAMKCWLGGFGFFMLHNTLQTVATQMVPQMRGTAIAAFALALFGGQAVGVGVAGRVGPSWGFENLFVGIAVGLACLGGIIAWQVAGRDAAAQ